MKSTKSIFSREWDCVSQIVACGDWKLALSRCIAVNLFLLLFIIHGRLSISGIF